MKIILLDKIQRLGEIGDVVDVNSGYARNFLIPQKKAAFASQKNIADVEAKKGARKEFPYHLSINIFEFILSTPYPNQSGL